MPGRFGSRRQFLGLLIATVLPVAANAAEENAVAFVRDLYQVEVARHAARGRIGEAEFLAVFARNTQRIWRAARDNRAGADVPAGPILNAFFGWGVLPGHDVKLVNVASPGGSAAGSSVAVELVIQGRPSRVLVRLLHEDGGMRISDFVYRRGESFVAYHRRLAGM